MSPSGAQKSLVPGNFLSLPTLRCPIILDLMLAHSWIGSWSGLCPRMVASCSIAHCRNASGSRSTSSPRVMGIVPSCTVMTGNHLGSKVSSVSSLGACPREAFGDHPLHLDAVRVVQ